MEQKPVSSFRKQTTLIIENLHTKNRMIHRQQVFVLPGSVIHGGIFFGIIYPFFASENPELAFLIAVFAIYVYLKFYRLLFKSQFISVVFGALLSAVSGIFYGDWLTERFFRNVFPLTVAHQAFTALIVFYIYMIFDLFRIAVFGLIKSHQSSYHQD